MRGKIQYRTIFLQLFMALWLCCLCWVFLWLCGFLLGVSVQMIRLIVVRVVQPWACGFLLGISVQIDSLIGFGVCV